MPFLIHRKERERDGCKRFFLRSLFFFTAIGLPSGLTDLFLVESVTVSTWRQRSILCTSRKPPMLQNWNLRAVLYFQCFQFVENRRMHAIQTGVKLIRSLSIIKNNIVFNIVSYLSQNNIVFNIGFNPRDQIQAKALSLRQFSGKGRRQSMNMRRTGGSRKN